MENDAIRDLLMNSPDIDSFVVSSSTLLKCIAENIVFYRSKKFFLSLMWVVHYDVTSMLFINYFFTQKSCVVLAKFFFYFIVLDHSILKQSLLSSSRKISDFSYFLRAEHYTNRQRAQQNNNMVDISNSK